MFPWLSVINLVTSEMMPGWSGQCKSNIAVGFIYPFSFFLVLNCNVCAYRTCVISVQRYKEKVKPPRNSRFFCHKKKRRHDFILRAVSSYALWRFTRQGSCRLLRAGFLPPCAWRFTRQGSCRLLRAGFLPPCAWRFTRQGFKAVAQACSLPTRASSPQPT